MDEVCSEDDRFVWDEDKYSANVETHGIYFEDVIPIFLEPSVYFDSTRREHGERRTIALGVIEGTVVLVAFTHKDSRIRIISARPANTKEKQRFRKHPYLLRVFLK